MSRNTVSARDVGPLLGEVRARFNVSVEAVANALAIDVGNVESAEQGGFPFSRTEILLYLRACQVPDDYLVEDVLRLAGSRAKPYQPDCVDPECRANQQAWLAGGGGLPCASCGGEFRHFDQALRSK